MLTDMNYVVTIARGFGSGGKEIGDMLGRELGIPCYEQEILKMASEYSGLNEALFGKADEKLSGSYLFNLVKRVNTTRITNPSDREFTSNDNLYQIQAEIIRQLAEEQSCIIVGKCANHLLRDYKNVLSVYVEANRETCVTHLMKKYMISSEEATKMIVKTEKYRSDYYRHYTGGRDWTNPTEYDITLNSGRLGKDGCVKILKGIVTEKFLSQENEK